MVLFNALYGKNNFRNWGMRALMNLCVYCHKFKCNMLCFDQAPPKAETTRQDQLNVKKAKKERNEEEEEGEKTSTTRGRGRGRGKGAGRGGRGGRGKASAEAVEGSTAAAASSRPTKQQSKHDKDWAAWGTDGAWSQCWDGGYEQWAWDSTAYWESRCAELELQFMQEQEALDAEQARKKRKAPKEPEEAEPCKDSKKTGKTADQAVDNKQEEDGDDKDVDMEEQQEEKTSKRKKASAKTTGKDKEAKEQKDQKKKDKKKKDKKEEKKESQPEKRKRARSSGQAATMDISSKTKEDQKTVVAIMNFMAGVGDLTEEDAQKLMRGRLKSFHACRLNVYWNRLSVGVHMRAEKKDFAYYRPIIRSDYECPKKYVMAAALKGSEILATWLTLYS